MSRPVILSVDDDLSVSRAIARDLRRRYGEGYRIVRAESGPDALEAINELVLRGEQVALLLADHRMPGMTGIEFLEQAMDVVPTARRALLTAYADTDAAIAAINTIDLDRYLLKPWAPPEEHLYPAIDELLDEFNAANRPTFDGLRVVGHRWSPRSTEVKQFLASNGVPFDWLDADHESARQLLDASRAGDDDLPLVVVPTGDVLRSPSTRDLAVGVGLSTTAERPFYDLVVVGGGPAGLGAAVYGASEGLRTLVIERSATGGQAGQSSMIANYLGFPRGVSGAELARRASDQARRFGVEILTANEVIEMSNGGAAHLLTLADGSEIATQSCIVATGVSYRRLPADVHDAFTGRGVYYGAGIHEAIDCRNEDIFVVGGANSAGQAAMHFSRYANTVTMLVRGDSLERTMSRYLVDEIHRAPNIVVETCTEVVGLDGGEHLEQLTLRNTQTGIEETRSAGRAFVFIGASPSTDWLGGGIVRDEHGFVLTGSDVLKNGTAPSTWLLERDPYHLETSVAGVFAAGDVRYRSVKRVASAVGEGAMAVMFVHRYLEEGSR